MRLTGLGARLPGLAALLRERLPAAADPRADRVRQPRRRRRSSASSCRSSRRSRFAAAAVSPRPGAAGAARSRSASSRRPCSAACTVVDKLAPGLVMAHFALSMVILIGAAALAWRARPALAPRRGAGRPRPRLGGARAARARRGRDLRRHRRDRRRAALRRRSRAAHRPPALRGLGHPELDGARPRRDRVRVRDLLPCSCGCWPSAAARTPVLRRALTWLCGLIAAPGSGRDRPVRDPSADRAGLGARHAGVAVLAVRAVGGGRRGAPRTRPGAQTRPNSGVRGAPKLVNIRRWR